MILKYTQEKNLNFSTRNCALLGTNGSGKSSLSKVIHDLNTPSNIQLIRAQRSLTINQGELRAIADDILERGLASYSAPKVGNDLTQDHSSNPTIKKEPNNITQTDFNKNIEQLFRDDMNAHANAHRKGLGEITTKAELIFKIWANIFTNKKIAIDDDGKIKVIYSKENLENSEDNVIKYEIENLSDGERSALYLITKCIHAPENGIIIVDEGETHLNPALLHDLWDNIEDARQDCKFVYISHSIDFITSRNDCTKFWIKNFNYSDDWEIEEIKSDKLPEELILQIIGTKKQKILFVESIETKDKLLYQKIYPDFKVIPVESCNTVISFTKALNKSSENYNKEYFGLIDKDFKGNKELKALNKSKIFALPVSEYENLFFRREVIKFIFTHLKKERSFKEKFKKLNDEVFLLKKDIKFKENFFKHHIQENFKKSLENFSLESDFIFKKEDEIINVLWRKIMNERNYNRLLGLLNTKSIKQKIANLGIRMTWSVYREYVLSIFITEKSDEFRKIFLGFMPNIK